MLFWNTPILVILAICSGLALPPEGIGSDPSDGVPPVSDLLELLLLVGLFQFLSLKHL